MIHLCLIQLQNTGFETHSQKDFLVTRRFKSIKSIQFLLLIHLEFIEVHWKMRVSFVAALDPALLVAHLEKKDESEMAL